MNGIKSWLGKNAGGKKDNEKGENSGFHSVKISLKIYYCKKVTYKIENE